MTKNHPVYDAARASRNGEGLCYLQAKDVAALVRTALKSAFPGVKFSVRSEVYSMGSSVHVRWTDGPREVEAERIANAYRFGGFDGMIDMAYSIQNWLMPDGSISLARSEGTQGSRGCHPEQVKDPVHPQSLLVSGGAKYVFCHRELSPEMERTLADLAATRFGSTVDHGKPYDQQTVAGEWLMTLMHRETSGYYEHV